LRFSAHVAVVIGSANAGMPEREGDQCGSRSDVPVSMSVTDMTGATQPCKTPSAAV